MKIKLNYLLILRAIGENALWSSGQVAGLLRQIHYLMTSF